MASANKNNELLTAWQKVLADSAAEPALFLADGRVEKTFAEIEAESAELAISLDPIAPGSVVAIQIGNHVSLPALLLASFRRALIPVLLPQQLESVAAVLDRCGAQALVTWPQKILVNTHATLPPNWQGAPPDFLKLTSGTTAEPRAIRFRAAQLVADCDQICTTMGIRSNDRNFGVIPFSHSYGFSNLITPLLCRGVPLVVAQDRLPRAILAGVSASGATVFPGMPVFFQNFTDLASAPIPPNLRLCISAGAPLPASVGEKFSDQFGLKIHTFYGASECGGIAYDRSDKLHYEDGFVGTAMSGVTITPRDAGEEISAIEVRSAAVGDGYFPEPDDALRDGCFVPGDLVRRTNRGFRLEGRVSDFINVAGRKLNPFEIESLLLSHPGVAQAVVFGIASPLRHEEPIACVVATRELRPDDLLRFCRENLSAWQVPKDFWFVPAIAASERGKVSRRELARRFLEQRGQPTTQ